MPRPARAGRIPRKEDVWLGTIGGLDFEDVCAKILEGCGFLTKKIGGSADGGRDIIIWSGDIKVLVECKHQAKPIGRPVVQKLHSAVITEQAKGGVILSTGGFTSDASGHPNTYEANANALEAIRRIRQDEIVLVGREQIALMAADVGINIWDGEDPASRDTDKDAVEKRFSGIKSHPEQISNLINTKTTGHRTETCWLVKVRIEQDFHTSTGRLIHKMRKNGTYACRPDGTILDGDLAKFVKSGGNAIAPKASSASASKAINRDVKKRYKETVTYKGKNGAEYTRVCEPKEQNIKKKFVPVGVKWSSIEVRFLRTMYPWRLPDLDMEIKCKACDKSKGMFESLLLCNDCGRIVHNGACGGECGVCKKTVCNACSRWKRGLVRTSWFCADCG